MPDTPDMPGASARKRPPRQSRTGLTSTGARKAGSKSERSRAREFALQGLYQSLVGGNAIARTMTRLVSSAIRVFNKQAINVQFVATEADAEAWVAQQKQADQQRASGA